MIYYGEDDIEAAMQRGEKLVPLTDDEARELINVPPLNRAQRRALQYGDKSQRPYRR